MSAPDDSNDRAPAATLVLELPDGLRRVPLAGGVTIGRDARSDVTIDHPTVSRHHARVVRVGGAWQFQDLGSRNGTRGGVTPGHPFDLIDGATLRIGRVRAWFFAGEVPAGWSPPEALPTDGKLIRCRCGHVGWAPSFIAGLSVRCRACKRRITVEDEVVSTAAATCAACRDVVAPSQAAHACSSCGAAMHADCYAELRGCATYGCDRVNELATPELHDVALADELPRAPRDDRWTLALLGLVGLPLFGLPAIVWGAIAARHGRGRATVVLTTVVGLTGAAASAVVWPRLWSAGGAAW